MQQQRRFANRAHVLCSTLFAFAPAMAGATALLAADSTDYIFIDSFEPADCSQPLTCSAPQAGKTCVAGQLRDAATTQPVHAAFNVGLTCGSGAFGGVCDLAVTAYDALEYGTNPSTAMPLPSGAAVVDGCGHYRIPDLTLPGSSYVVIVARDAVPPDSEGHVPSATPRAVAANQKFDGITAITTEKLTTSIWNDQVGLDVASQGALLLSYTTDGSPTSGVTVFRGSGDAGTVFYFSDTDAQRLTASNSAASTGADGSALVTNATLGTYSGTGGETGGCHWTNVIGESLPGVVLYGELACTP